MFKYQLKFQKILYLALLFLQVALFAYSIGLATDFYPLYLCDAYGYLPQGIEFFNRVQIYNSNLIKFAIVLILASLLPFIFSSNTRRKYYIDNFVTQVLQAVSYIACAIFLIVNSASYKADFLNAVNITEYAQICTENGWYFTGSTIFLDLGFVFAGLLIVSVALIVINYIWKYKLVETENRILNGEVE